ncbi:DNA polymerase [Burkholderia territorii]|uniref:DNA polymerase n=1 Tax=Burkholderia territorii TaxID=1503055 RepID=UPI0018C84DE3|nr:DNA polymerase [Burkholderia territorii]
MDTCDVLIGHNIIDYDLPALKKVLGYVYKGKVVDTLIMSRMLNPKRFLPPHAENKRAGPHSLYAWGVRCGVDKPEYDAWNEGFTEEMLHRCAEDVRINVRTYHKLMEEAASSGGKWGDAFKLTFKLFENLHEQEQYGWYVDQQKMHENIKALEKIMQEIDDEVIPQLPLICEPHRDYKACTVNKPFLKSGKPSKSTYEWFGDNWDVVGGIFSRICFRRVDLNSRNETVDFLLKEGWEPVEWNYNDDGERTSPKLSKDDPFEGVEGEVGKLVAKRVQCRHRKSLIEGLLDLVREDGRIASAIAGMAVTGRMQHRGIVNIPAAKSFFGKELRQMFSCAPGKVLVSTDSDQNQLRQLAARMLEPAYIEAIVNGRKEDGTDVHTLAQKMAELPTRDDAKTFQYGVLFGAGDAKTGKIVKGTAAHGRALKERFFKNLPGLQRLMDRLIAEWRKTAKKKFNPKWNRIEYYDGTITGLDGRPIKVASEHQILVYLLQSDEAIQMSAAYNWAIAKLKKKYRYGEQVHVVCFYHDEFTFECDEDIAEDVKAITEEAIAWAGRFYNIQCPHVGQGKIGRNWYEVH